MRYLDSAFKHGVEVEDITHACGFRSALINLDNSRTLILGPGRAGQLLEVVVVDLHGGGNHG